MSQSLKPPPSELCDARASGRTQSHEAMHRLSMVHKTRKPKPQKVFQVWKKGSLAICPGIPNLDPKNTKSDQSPGGIRGKVTTLSDASRRNLMTYLATLEQDTPRYTMALTLPGDASQITSEETHKAFKKLCNRFTASKRFPSVAFIWKRELQRRGVLHYHLLITGLNTDDEGPHPVSFQLWVARTWNLLVCEGLSHEEKWKHLNWHCHEKNMQPVRGNIYGYFAKYVGKPLDVVHEEIPGRWWGKVNTKAIPVAKKSELVMPDRAAIMAHRLCRKVTRKRANAAKHYRACTELGLIDRQGKPTLSEFEVLTARHGHLRGVHKSRYEEICYFSPDKLGLFGKARVPKFVRFNKIKLISDQSPQTALSIMRYVEGAFRDWLEVHPF